MGYKTGCKIPLCPPLASLDKPHHSTCFPSQTTFPSLANSRINTCIWLRLRSGKTCCNSLNRVLPHCSDEHASVAILYWDFDQNQRVLYALCFFPSPHKDFLQKHTFCDRYIRQCPYLLVGLTEIAFFHSALDSNCFRGPNAVLNFSLLPLDK